MRLRVRVRVRVRARVRESVRLRLRLRLSTCWLKFWLMYVASLVSLAALLIERGSSSPRSSFAVSLHVT